MGTDIYMIAEVKKDKWIRQGKIFKSCLSDKLTHEPYDGRNYILFHVLANVRGGFAEVTPITAPRGFPKDLSLYLDEQDTFSEGHSSSYIYLKELLEYNWDKKIVRCGYVNCNEYLIYKKKGFPESWCIDISGIKIKKITNKEMDNLSVNDACSYTKIEWGTTIRKSVGFFITDTIPALTQLGSPKNVRIVFDFDC